MTETNVMTSSTARDLSDYRQQVMDACLRAGMLPKMMEHLPVLDAPEPVLPPFDESQFEPLPEVEINPPDEVGGEG